LKSNKKTRDIPIIFASAIRKEQQFVIKGFEEGGIDYLSKPLDLEITKAKVSVFLKMQLQKKELLEKNRSLQTAKEEIKLLNTELQKNLDQLEAANKELEAFSYSVSHDLKAPLRAVNAYAEILEQDFGHALGEEENRLIGNIKRNGLKMGVLINDLLEFSRLGRRPVSKSHVEMTMLVHRVVADMPRSEATGILLDDMLPAQADSALLGHVWTNLISNAIKYSAKKEDPLIQIGCKKSGGEIIYHVKDNGAGFDMRYAEKLFGVFQRLHSAAEFEGTGIGLAIVQRIITKHGGRVWAEAEEGNGACFYFTLPA
jgi:two-component system sensor histidine kinase/response regulator